MEGSGCLAVLSMSHWWERNGDNVADGWNRQASSIRILGLKPRQKGAFSTMSLQPYPQRWTGFPVYSETLGEVIVWGSRAALLLPHHRVSGQTHDRSAQRSAGKKLQAPGSQTADAHFRAFQWADLGILYCSDIPLCLVKYREHRSKKPLHCEMSPENVSGAGIGGLLCCGIVIHGGAMAMAWERRSILVLRSAMSCHCFPISCLWTMMACCQSSSSAASMLLAVFGSCGACWEMEYVAGLTWHFQWMKMCDMYSELA